MSCKNAFARRTFRPNSKADIAALLSRGCVKFPYKLEALILILLAGRDAKRRVIISEEVLDDSVDAGEVGLLQ